MTATTLTICICTSGRPAELDRCLASIEAGDRLPDAVIVSDDSAHPDGRRAVVDVVARYPFANYLEGPRRGLCANRNRVIAAVTTSHLSLLDDDAAVGPNFISNAYRLAASTPDAIFSGDVLEGGDRRTPTTNQTFLGHFGRPPRSGEPLSNIHLNCNVLPTAATRDADFSESIVYGYEDCDYCAQLVARGWRIVYQPELTNSHLPPPSIEKRARHWQAERARFKVRARQLLCWRPDPLSYAGFAAIAPLHFAASALKSGRPDLAFHGWAWLVADLGEAWRLRREAGRSSRVDSSLRGSLQP